MKSKANFKIAYTFKLSLIIVVFGLVAIYSQSISNYIQGVYNNQIEFLASNTISKIDFSRY